MTQKTRPLIQGRASVKAAPAYASPVDTPALQEAAKAAAVSRVKQIEAANLAGQTLPEERNPSRD